MTADRPIEDLSFEEALHELEAIVSRLESGETPLQDAIDLYERGNKLRRRCADRLDAAQARIEAIRLDVEGRPVRSEEHTFELQSLMRISYAVFCLTHKKKHKASRTRDEY